MCVCAVIYLEMGETRGYPPDWPPPPPPEIFQTTIIIRDPSWANSTWDSYALGQQSGLFHARIDDLSVTTCI